MEANAAMVTPTPGGPDPEIDKSPEIDYFMKKH
jgi:hypothetical protein